MGVVFENGRGEVVGEVAEDAEGAAAEEAAEIDGGGVGVEDFHAVGGEAFAEVGDEAVVFFDEGDAGWWGGELEEVFGEGAQAGADFQDPVGGLRGEGVNDPLGQILVNEEVLPEAFGGGEVELV